MASQNRGEQLFLDELETIERAIRFASRRGALRPEDVEDFASYVKLKLIDDDYAIVRKNENRASFAAFISVVVQRLLLDYRIAQWGKWHSSAQARRLGEPAITIEAMLYRDGRTIDEVLPLLLRRWPHLTRESVDSLVLRLPSRAPRPRAVALDSVSAALMAGNDDSAFEPERARVARRIAATVRDTMNDLEERDRLIFRLRFDGGLSVADVSRLLKMDQKPLYRRLQRALSLLRKRLEASGVSAEDAQDILASRNTDLDFGFGGGAVSVSGSSTDEEGA